MTNAEKYKAANERAMAFENFCHKNSGPNGCRECPLESLMPNCGDSRAQFAWLDLEADDDKLLPCPFCGSKDVSLHRSINNFWFVECNVCTAKSAQNVTKETAIATYNGVAKAVMEANNKGE